MPPQNHSSLALRPRPSVAVAALNFFTPLFPSEIFVAFSFAVMKRRRADSSSFFLPSVFFRHLSAQSVDFTPCPVSPTRKSSVSFALSTSVRKTQKLPHSHTLAMIPSNLGRRLFTYIKIVPVGRVTNSDSIVAAIVTMQFGESWVGPTNERMARNLIRPPRNLSAQIVRDSRQISRPHSRLWLQLRARSRFAPPSLILPPSLPGSKASN